MVPTTLFNHNSNNNKQHSTEVPNTPGQTACTTNTHRPPHHPPLHPGAHLHLHHRPPHLVQAGGQQPQQQPHSSTTTTTSDKNQHNSHHHHQSTTNNNNNSNRLNRSLSQHYLRHPQPQYTTCIHNTYCQQQAEIRPHTATNTNPNPSGVRKSASLSSTITSSSSSSSGAASSSQPALIKIKLDNSRVVKLNITKLNANCRLCLAFIRYLNEQNYKLPNNIPIYI